VAQLTSAGLVNEFQIVINPLALGSGKTLFEGLEKPIDLQVKTPRTFKNGKIYL
jgi:dihydrofolate reductase